MINHSIISINIYYKNIENIMNKIVVHDIILSSIYFKNS